MIAARKLSHQATPLSPDGLLEYARVICGWRHISECLPPDIEAIASDSFRRLAAYLESKTGKPAFAREAAAEHHEQRGNRVLIVEPRSTRQRAKAAPQVVIEALAEAVCERGLDALRHPTNRVRLAELNPAQRDELRQRVRVLKAISTGEKL